MSDPGDKTNDKSGDQPTDNGSDTGNERASDRGRAQIDAKLLEILVCPLTKKPLQYDSARQELISPAANLAFPIRDGVPLMTIEDARSLD